MSHYVGHDPAMVYVPIARAGMADARPSFRALFCTVLARTPANSPKSCDYWLRRFDDEADVEAPPLPKSLSEKNSRPFDLLIVSGIFAECLPDVPAFSDTIKRFQQLGYRLDYVPVKGRASSEFNADIIATTIRSLRANGYNKKFVVLAYSKGAADILTAMDRHPSLNADIAAVISFSGAVNGSPLADQYQSIYDKVLAQFPYNACPVNDGGEMVSLTRAYRLNWLATHRIPSTPLLFSIVAAPIRERVSAVLAPMYGALSQIDPRNDGQVLHFDALLPSSTLLGYVNADHFAIALPFLQRMPMLALTLVDMNDFPRSQLVEAAVLYVEDILVRQMADQPVLNLR